MDLLAWPDFCQWAGAQAASQLLFENRDIGERAVIGLAGAFTGDIGGGDDMNLMAQMIESQQAIEEHQHAIGQRQIVLGVLADFFQLANGVVGEIADGASGERWQARKGRRTMLAGATPSRWVERCPCGCSRALAALQHDILATGSHLQVRTRSQERVAADLLSALDGFQQESVRLM